MQTVTVRMGGFHAEIHETMLKKESSFFDAYIQRWKRGNSVEVKGFDRAVCEVILCYLLCDTVPLRKHVRSCGPDGIARAAEYLGMENLSTLAETEKYRNRDILECTLCGCGYVSEENENGSCSRNTIEGKCVDCGQDAMLCRDIACNRNPIVGFHVPR